MLKKKPKDNSNSKNSDTGFNGDINGKQIAINVYNMLIKVLAK
jgi:hypothetical protein